MVKQKRVVARMILPVALTLILSTQLAVAQSSYSNDYPSEQTIDVPGYPPIIMPVEPTQSNTFDNRLQTCSQIGEELGATANSGPNNLSQFAAQCAD
jgi:hypothetical protein